MAWGTGVPAGGVSFCSAAAFPFDSGSSVKYQMVSTMLSRSSECVMVIKSCGSSLLANSSAALNSFSREAILLSKALNVIRMIGALMFYFTPVAHAPGSPTLPAHQDTLPFLVPITDNHLRKYRTRQPTRASAQGLIHV